MAISIVEILLRKIKLQKKDSLRKFTLEMQYAKRKGWKNFCSEMQDLSTNSKISKILKIDEKKEIGTIRNTFTGELSSTP